MSLARQFFRYMAVGGLATVGHYGILIALVEGAVLSPVPAALCAFVAGGLVSYLLNYRVTFQSERPHAEAAASFATVAFSGFLITGLLMHLLVERGGIGYLAAQVATTVVVFFWTFVANRLWTFGSKPKRAASPAGRSARSSFNRGPEETTESDKSGCHPARER